MATTYFVDASTGSDSNAGTSTGAAWLTIAHALATVASGDTVYIKAGTYIQTATLVYPVAILTLIGYQITPGDYGTKPLITTATSSLDLMSTSSNNGRQVWQNISFSNTAGTKANGLKQLSTHGTDQWWIFIDCVFDGFTGAVNADDSGAHFDVGFMQLVNCEFKNCTGAGSSFYTVIGATTRFEIYGCNFHDNAGGQMIFCNSGIFTMDNTLLTDNTVAGQIFWPGGGCSYQRISSCTFANNASASCFTGRNMNIVYNCLFYGNHTGISGDNTTNDGLAGAAASRNNAFGANSTNFGGWTSSPWDVLLTANPFTNSATRDYSLNSAAGGGTLIKAAGFPSTFQSGTTTSALAIGCVQSASGGGGGSSEKSFSYIG